MFIGVHKLVEDNRISYAVLDHMIRAGHIKNLFIITDKGFFKDVNGIEALENSYHTMCEQKLEYRADDIKRAKDELKRVCQKYREVYKDIKRMKYNIWTGEGLDICREQISEFMKKDPYDYKTKIYYLRQERNRYKNEIDRLNVEKYSHMYHYVFLFKIEYEQATEAYVKGLLTQAEGN